MPQQARADKIKLDPSDVTCPDGYALLLNAGPHAGAYIKCEEYDGYIKLLQGGQTDAAEKKLLTPVRHVKESSISA